MSVIRYGAPDYFDSITTPALRYSRDLGLEVGLELGAVLVADPAGGADDQPVAMMLELPPGYTLERHAHGCHRVEVVVRGSVELADGTVLTPGDLWTSAPGEFYGPHTAGPDGVLTVEIFGSSRGFAPTAAEDASPQAQQMLADIRRRTQQAQAPAD